MFLGKVKVVFKYAEVRVAFLDVLELGGIRISLWSLRLRILLNCWKLYCSHINHLNDSKISKQKYGECYGKYSLSFELEFISAFDLLNFCLTFNLIHFIISRRSLAN